MTESTADLFDPTAVRAKAGDAIQILDRGSKMVSVEGPPGSGRAMVVDIMAERLGDDAIVVRVPAGNDPDAPIHALLQAAAALGRTAVADAADGTTSSLDDRFKSVVAGLAQRRSVLVLHLPDDFRAASRDDDPSGGWIERLVRGIADNDQLKFALVAPRGALHRHDWLIFKRLELPVARAELKVLKSPAAWGGYSGFASMLHPHLRTDQPWHPLQVRLMVGLVALGLPISRVVSIGTPGKLLPLVRCYVELFRTAKLRGVRDSVRRFLLAREPLRMGDAFAIARASGDVQPLLRHCLAYGDERLRVQPELRATLLAELDRAPDEEQVHKHIADVHAKSDGARSAEEAVGKSRVELHHWLEKVHHLAHAGALGAADWTEQKLSSREFLIDHARALSLGARWTQDPAATYRAAAEVYGECLRLWPNDAYALHYRGFNLDRAGGDPKTVNDCLRAAIASDRANPFYNSRLVTFLIEQGRPLEADAAWQAALENVGERSAEDVAYHVVLHVVMAWLNAGDVARARAAFENLDPRLEIVGPLDRLRERLLDAEEAEALGFAAYPTSVPLRKRWGSPRLAQPRSSGRPLRAWYPGRVVAVEDDRVVVSWVDPETEPRRVYTREMGTEEWMALAGQTPTTSTFIELADYGREEPVIFVDPSPTEPESDEARAPHPLRYLMVPVKDSVVG